MTLLHQAVRSLTALSLCLATASHAAPDDRAETVVYRSQTGKTLTVVYEADGDHVKVHWPVGKVIVMNQAISASGSRYTAGAMEFWEHHGEGTLYRKDKLLFQGKPK